MSVYPEPFHQHDHSEIRKLMKSLAFYALRELGNRRGLRPELEPEDLVQTAFMDCIYGARRTEGNGHPPGRRFNGMKQGLEPFLRGCIRSYISHYSDSSEGWRRQDPVGLGQAMHFGEIDFEDPGADKRLARIKGLVDNDVPESYLEADQVFNAIEDRVRRDGEGEVILLWEIFLRGDYCLKQNRREICEEMGLDAETSSPDYQKFNRCRNRLKELMEVGWQDSLA